MDGMCAPHVANDVSVVGKARPRLGGLARLNGHSQPGDAASRWRLRRADGPDTGQPARDRPARRRRASSPQRTAPNITLALLKAENRNWMLQGRSCCGDFFSNCVHCRCETTNEQILRTASTVPQLRTLTLMRGIKAHTLREICANCPNLTNLQIHSSQEMDSSLLEYVFDKCPKIKKLKLWKGLLANRQCAELVSSLEHLGSLELLESDSRSGRVLLRVLADGCPRLEEINFEGTYSVDELNYFFEAKKHNLTSVTVYWTAATTEWIRGSMCVVPLLKQCGSSLRKLRLLNFDVPRSEQAAAFKAISELHSLQELFLPDIAPRTPEVISLAFRPGCLTQLRRLHLMSAHVLEDETLVAISRGCPNLRELRLDFVAITGVGLNEIHRLKHLEILELTDCQLLHDGTLAHVVQLPALHTLVLRHYGLLTEQQSNIQHILDMKQLRCLDILGWNSLEHVPFEEFPERLINLRKLHVECGDDEKYKLHYKSVFTALQYRMPHLKIFNTFPMTEDDFMTDDEKVDSSDDDDDHHHHHNHNHNHNHNHDDDDYDDGGW